MAVALTFLHDCKGNKWQQPKGKRFSKHYCSLYFPTRSSVIFKANSMQIIAIKCCNYFLFPQYFKFLLHFKSKLHALKYVVGCGYLLSQQQFQSLLCFLTKTKNLRENDIKCDLLFCKLLATTIPKPNILLYSPYYAEACNEFVLSNCPSPRHSTKAKQHIYSNHSLR